MRASRSKALLLGLLVLTVGLAGCAGSEDPPQDDDGQPEEPVAETPRWRLGDAWTYSIKTEGFPQTETTMLVYDQTADLYRIGTTDEQQALIHALFNVNPQIGRIQKGNLGVFEDGEPRAMYRFPIEDGDTWQTEFFISQHGGTLTAQATWSESIQTDAGTMEGFEIEATNPAGFEVVYDYIPEIQWFSKLVVTDGEGHRLHNLRLQAYERGVNGTGYFVRGDDLFDEAYTANGCGLTGCSDTVLVDGASAKGGKYGPYHLVAFNVQVNVTSDNDRVRIEIQDGAGDTIYQRQFLEDQQNEFRFETVRDFEPGDWTVTVNPSGQARASVRLAGAWSYSGTV